MSDTPISDDVRRILRDTATDYSVGTDLALEDAGLASALRFQREQLRAEGWHVSYEEALGGDERLPSPIETPLFRVAQEALTNVGSECVQGVRGGKRSWRASGFSCFRNKPP